MVGGFARNQQSYFGPMKTELVHQIQHAMLPSATCSLPSKDSTIVRGSIPPSGTSLQSPLLVGAAEPPGQISRMRRYDGMFRLPGAFSRDTNSRRITPSACSDLIFRQGQE